MDPTILLSGVSATLQAIQTWIQFRDSQRAARAFESQIERAPADRSIRRQAEALASLVPAEIIDTMTARARNCWTRYHGVLTGDYLPGEIDEATVSVRRCLCRELRRIKDLNILLPDGELQRWWDAYCSSDERD